MANASRKKSTYELMEGLKLDIQNLENRLTQNFRNDMQNLENRLTQNFRNDMQNLENRLEGEMKRLDNKIENVKTELKNEYEKEARRTNDKIEDIELRLSVNENKSTVINGRFASEPEFDVYYGGVNLTSVSTPSFEPIPPELYKIK